MRSHRVILVIASAALGASPAEGQTLFEWPEATVDVSAYTTIEECRAAVARVRNDAARRERRGSGVWRDTIPYDPADDRAPLPAAVGETTRRCLGRFATVDSVSLEYLSVLVPLYVHAGWEAKAQALIERRIAAIESGDEDELWAVLDTVMRIYEGATGGPRGALRVRPPRPALAREIVLKYLPRISDRVRRFRLYRRMPWMFTTGDAAVDSARVEELMAQILALADSLTDQERLRLEEETAGFLDHAGLEEQIYGFYKMRYGEGAFLDSLRRSTESYVKARRQAWSEAWGQPPETFGNGMPIGERAPALEGDVWLGCDGPCGQRPRTGAVSLVLFIDHAACMGVASGVEQMHDGCADNLIVLRRLENRFPALETTVVARTHGYFRYLKESITPAREAESMRRWLDSFGVRAPLAVTFTDHWRLPDPDDRRIERVTPNQTNYGFGGTWGAGSTVAFLIDQDGIIVYSHQFHYGRVGHYIELIEALLERGAATS